MISPIKNGNISKNTFFEILKTDPEIWKKYRWKLQKCIRKLCGGNVLWKVSLLIEIQIKGPVRTEVCKSLPVQ